MANVVDINKPSKNSLAVQSKALQAVMQAPLKSSRPKTSQDLLLAWETEFADPPVSEDEALELALMGEADRVASHSEATQAAAILSKAYSEKLKNRDKDDAAFLLQSWRDLFEKHHPKTVLEVVSGEDKIQLHESWPPDLATLKRFLTRAHAKLFAGVNRARLAVAVYAAKSLPDVTKHPKWSLYRSTRNGDAALALVREYMEGNG